MGNLSEQNAALCERVIGKDFRRGSTALFAEEINRLLDAARSEGPSPGYDGLREAVSVISALLNAWPADSVPSGPLCVRASRVINSMNPDFTSDGGKSLGERFREAFTAEFRDVAFSMSAWAELVPPERWDRAAVTFTASLSGREGEGERSQSQPCTEGALPLLKEPPSDLDVALARRAYVMSEPHLGGHRVIVGFEGRDDAWAAHMAVAALPNSTGEA